MAVEWILTIAGVVALAYQAFALLACIAFVEKRRLRYGKPLLSSTPPISVLKPVRGVDEGLIAALRSHLVQDYPDYEVLVGIHSKQDPAWPLIEQLQREFPESRLRLFQCSTETANGKVGVLIDLARQARHDVWLVNDADIAVPPEYLRRVVAPLDDEGTGLVTCLYRPIASSLAGRFESLIIATDFIPSTLVAPMVGVREFGLGSTLCFRAKDLKERGGFEALGDFIADDYQLAKAITGSGKRAVLSEVVVDTALSSPSWGDVWRHQLRWAKTLRVSRTDGYLGLPVTHAGLWAIVCLVAGLWPMALTLWLARSLMGAYAGFTVLRHKPALALAPLIPLCDLWGFGMWVSAWMGGTVRWRDKTYQLARDGRIKPVGQEVSADDEPARVPQQREEPAHRS